MHSLIVNPTSAVRSPALEPGPGFLALPQLSDAVQAEYARDIVEDGRVTNLSRLWAHAPSLRVGLLEAGNDAARVAGLGLRDRALLVTAVAATLGDRYCALVWGTRLAEAAGPDTARDVLYGAHARLAARDRVLADWAHRVTTDPVGALRADIETLRDLGMDDAQILGLTVFVAVRRAFASVNDALGLPPDAELLATCMPVIREGLPPVRRTSTPRKEQR